MKFKYGAIALALLSSVMAFTPTANADKYNNTLDVAYGRGVATTDGLYSTSRENDILGLLVDDALFYIDPDSGQPVPLAAKSSRFEDDTTFIVELRDDVTFHDGSLLTPEDVVYSFRHIISPEGATKFASRIGAWMESVEASGPHEVTFKLKQPYAMVHYDLSYYSKLRKKGSYELDGATNPEAQNTLALGTGPYRVTKFLPGERVELELHSGYRSGSPKAAEIQKIVIRFIPDETTRAAEIMSGGIDWSFGFSTELAENVGRTGRAQVLSVPSLRVGYLSLDAAGRSDPETPLKDVRVRQALNYAVNREELVATIVGGGAKAARTPCHSLQFGCDQDVKHYEYNPEKAKELLAQAGYPDGIDLELYASREPTVQEAVIAYWAKAGIRANLRFMKSISKDRNEGKLALYYDTWGSYSIPDAGAIIPNLFQLSTKKVYTGDEELSENVSKINTTLDKAEREKRMSEVVNYIVDQAYWVPIQEYPLNFLMSNELEYDQSKDGMQRLFMARWK